MSRRTDFPLLAIGLLVLASGCSAPAPGRPDVESGSDELGEEPDEPLGGSPLVMIELLPLDALARWLVIYDHVAWVSSDLVQEAEHVHSRLGREWFCYEDPDTGWHSVFGRYDPDTDTYDAVLHYDVDEANGARAATAEVPMDRALPIARAIHASFPLLVKELGEVGIQMNTYARSVEEGIEIRYLPAMLPDGRCLNGGEFCFRFDREGRQLLGRDHLVTEFLAFEPGEDQAIVLEDLGRSIPSLGNVFFAIQHRGRFAKIRIETDTHVAQLVESNEGLSWILIEREEEE